MNIKWVISALFFTTFINTSIFALDITAAERGKSCFKSGKCGINNNLSDIIDLTHFIYKISKEKFNKNNDFASGTIVFEDINGKVFKDLREFVRKTYGSQDCKEISISLKSAYPRRSTHFNDYYRFRGFAKTNCDYAHYGIDVPAGSLPMKDKKHILFGHLGQLNGKTWSFIKMEEAGLKGLDALSHGIDLIKKSSQRLLPSMLQSLKTKLGLIKVEEKNFLKEFDDLLASAETEGSESELLKNRRERVPLEYLAYFMAILVEARDNQKLDNAKLATIKDRIKALGIQAIVNSTTWKDAISDPSTAAQLTKVADALKNRYNVVNSRFGNEIIIDSQNY